MIGAVSWAGGAVKIFRTRKFWERAILKYNKNFSILYIEDERGSNKINFPLQRKQIEKICFLVKKAI